MGAEDTNSAAEEDASNTTEENTNNTTEEDTDNATEEDTINTTAEETDNPTEEDGPDNSGGSDADDTTENSEDGTCNSNGNTDDCTAAVISAPAADSPHDNPEVSVFDLTLDEKVCSYNGLFGLVDKLVGLMNNSEADSANESFGTLYQNLFARCVSEFGDTMELV